jgi:hypothetical protein
MATTIAKPMSEAEAYLAEGAREISERLQDLLLQARQSRPRRQPDLVRAAAEHPVATAFVAGVVLAVLLAGGLIARPR